MGRIADVADVGRATLYRHFPTREALFDALRARGYDEVREAIAASRIDEGTALEALERVFVALLDVSDRYRVFAAEERPGRPRSPHDRARRAVAAPLVGVVERGQRAGEISADVPVDWVLTVLSSTVLLSLRRIARGESTRDEAIRLGLATLLDGLRA